MLTILGEKNQNEINLMYKGYDDIEMKTPSLVTTEKGPLLKKNPLVFATKYNNQTNATEILAYPYGGQRIQTDFF